MTRRITSTAQFKMLVAFMEEHGDLCKPSGTPRGRVIALKKWIELADMLNSIGNGERRSAERWRKVWSDLKSNVRKKAQKAKKDAEGAGVSTDLEYLLTDFDNRVLSTMDAVSVTGLEDVPEILNIEESPVTLGKGSVSITPPTHIKLSPNKRQSENGNSIPSISRDVVANPTKEVGVMASTSPQMDATPSISTFVVDDEPQVSSDEKPITPQQIPRKRTRTPLRNLRKRIRSDTAMDKFEKSDSEWRKYRLHKLEFEEERMKREVERMKAEEERLIRQQEIEWEKLKLEKEKIQLGKYRIMREDKRKEEEMKLEAKRMMRDEKREEERIMREENRQEERMMREEKREEERIMREEKRQEERMMREEKREQDRIQRQHDISMAWLKFAKGIFGDCSRGDE